ncbi:MAG: flagellar basal body rod C-terminal domain-containing protein [bacterium]
MRLYGGINLSEDGISTSVRGLHLQTELMNNINENVVGFNKIGYQRKVPVVSSFAEIIGVHALSEVVDTAVGRMRQTKNPLDFILAKEGYFQCQTPFGVKLTRDGRFKLDKDGYLLTLDDNKILSANGQPIKFQKIPEKLSDIKVNQDGIITALDQDSKEFYEVGQFSVVANNGSTANEIDVRQGFTENSNVNIYAECFNLVPVRRNFEANRQLFIIQNDNLSKTIQELGRAS